MLTVCGEEPVIRPGDGHGICSILSCTAAHVPSSSLHVAKEIDLIATEEVNDFWINTSDATVKKWIFDEE